MFLLHGDGVNMNSITTGASQSNDKDLQRKGKPSHGFLSKKNANLTSTTGYFKLSNFYFSTITEIGYDYDC